MRKIQFVFLSLGWIVGLGVMYGLVLFANLMLLRNAVYAQDKRAMNRYAVALERIARPVIALCPDCKSAQEAPMGFLPFQLVATGSQVIQAALILEEVGAIWASAVMTNQPDKVQAYWPPLYSALNQFLQTVENFSLLYPQLPMKEYFFPAAFQQGIQAVVDHRLFVEQLSASIPDLLAYEGQPKKYTVLLQNNMELRATGGFIGSYAQMEFKQGALNDIYIQDIYVPDGAIPGHVQPPPPIQQAFQQGWWRLRDSNWDPDFPSAMETVRWFFNKGRVDPGAGIMAVNMSLIEEILGQVGEIYLPDYQMSINKDTLYLMTQHESEKNFFPGSTQKRDFLNGLTQQLKFSLESVSSQQALGIIQAIVRGLDNRDIQLSFTDPTVQKLIQERKWDGQIQTWDSQARVEDFLYLVESNLGSNKANCCVEREVSQKVQEVGDQWQVQLTLKYHNSSPAERPKPPKFWGGDYENYLRLVIPKEAFVKTVTVGEKQLKGADMSIYERTDKPFQELGFFAYLPHSSRQTVTVEYQIAKRHPDNLYSVYVQKQSGLEYWFTSELAINGQTFQVKQKIDQDRLIQF